jgi:hypothetical protein
MSQSVRPFNTQIIGMSRPDNLIPQIIPAIGKINTADFRPGDRANVLTFGFASQTTARLGIFVAEKDGVERIVIMLLPATGRPDNVLICINAGVRAGSREPQPARLAQSAVGAVREFRIAEARDQPVGAADAGRGAKSALFLHSPRGRQQ